MTTAPTPDLKSVIDEALQALQPEIESPEAVSDILADEPQRDEIISAIKDLAKYVIGLDKWVRRQEVIEARRQRFFWRGDQYLYWKSDAVGIHPCPGRTVGIS
jgi:hypothetical protein